MKRRRARRNAAWERESAADEGWMNKEKFLQKESSECVTGIRWAGA
jgi:hypothetical protein